MSGSNTQGNLVDTNYPTNGSKARENFANIRNGLLTRNIRFAGDVLECDITLTTGQVAALMGVAPRTVSLWCDTGMLDHFRIPSGHRITTQYKRKPPEGDSRFGKDRRIPIKCLLAFLKKEGIPVPKSLRHLLCTPHVLMYGLTTRDHETINQQLGQLDSPFKVHTAQNAFDVGMYLESLELHQLSYAVIGDINGTTEVTQLVSLILTKFPRCVVFYIRDIHNPQLALPETVYQYEQMAYPNPLIPNPKEVTR